MGRKSGWTDAEDVQMAEMISAKVTDREQYLTAFGRHGAWFNIKLHGEKDLGHDMSFVEGGRKAEKKVLPLLPKTKRKYTRHEVSDLMKGPASGMTATEMIGTDISGFKRQQNIIRVADWILEKLNSDVS